MRRPETTPGILLLAIVAIMALSTAGCLGETTVDIGWATPPGSAISGTEQEIQQLFDTYTQALVARDRDAFLSLIDAGNPDFLARQQQFFDYTENIPFDRYSITLDSLSEADDGSITAKTSEAFTLKGSFAALPDADRAGYRLVRHDDGWKLAGDATLQALGKERDARLWDLGKVEVAIGEHAIVLYHAAGEAVAGQAGGDVDRAYAQLTEALPGVEMPLVPVWVFSGKEQIDQAYPGQWQDWVGGASRQLGYDEEQGGEIILDARLFNEIGSYDPEYNRKMIAHELTHVALFSRTGDTTPSFLVEGLADFVAGLEATPYLAGKLRNGETISPTLRDLYYPSGFNVLISDEAATLAYEIADTAVAYLEREYGNEKVVMLLREFKRRELDTQHQEQLVDEVFRSVLGVGTDEFENGWRLYVLKG